MLPELFPKFMLVGEYVDLCQRLKMTSHELGLDPTCQRRDWEDAGKDKGGLLEILNARFGTKRNVLSLTCDDAAFFYHARTDMLKLIAHAGALEERVVKLAHALMDLVAEYDKLQPLVVFDKDALRKAREAVAEFNESPRIT